jgi:MFS family permease
MNVTTILGPKPSISEPELARGLRMITWQGVTASAMFSVVNSGFLAAYALALGANNLQIGILAAIPFIMQPFQIPAVALVERLRLRKLIAVLTWFPAQAMWLVIGLIPLFVDAPSGPAVALLLGAMALRGSLTAFVTASWNSWLRDLVPQDVLGRFFSRRLAVSTIASVVFGLAAAFFIDYWRGQASSENVVFGYTFVLVFGAVFLGLTSPVFMALAPEPRMQPPPQSQASLLKTLAAPFRDRNFSHLIRFLFLWGLASNLAVPFFIVYMLNELRLPLSVVIGLSVLSQMVTVLFLRVWGPMADRYGNKVVLSLAASLYLMVILGWTFTTMPGRHILTFPLLVMLHIFGGMASAGLNLGAETIGLKLAPKEQATSYLVGASLAASLGSAIGPLLGGRFADFFSVRALELQFNWADPSRTIELPALSLTGFDFLFAIAFLLGLLTLNTLNALKEEGEVSREVALSELYAQTQEMSRPVSSVPGLGFVAYVPYSILRRVPGLGVAVGVTAYQLASSVKGAVTTAARGKEAATNLAERINQAVSRTAQAMEDVDRYGMELARHATRGAVQASDEVDLDAGHLAKEAVVGAVLGLGKAKVNPWDALRGAGYGIIQGAVEVWANLDEVALEAVKGARQIADELGMKEQDAAAQVARGALDAAQALGPEAAARVKEALEEHLVDSGYEESIDCTDDTD